MNRAKINYLIDIGLAISFFVCFITGLIKWPGLVKTIDANFYGLLSNRKISMLHDLSGLIMGILVMVHLALHWKWVVAMTKNFFSGKKDNNN